MQVFIFAAIVLLLLYLNELVTETVCYAMIIIYRYVTAKQLELLVHGYEVKDMNKGMRDEVGEGKAASPTTGMKKDELASPKRKNVHVFTAEEDGDYVLKSPTRVTIGGGGSPMRVKPRQEKNSDVKKHFSRKPPAINAKQAWSK
jgi:hypothetical protein